MPRAPLPKPAGVQHALQQAVTLHQQGRLDDAEKLYNGILAGAPKNFDALHLLGVLMNQRGRTADALKLIEKALATGAKSADALQNRANVLFAMKRFGEALAGYDKALALRPGDAQLLSNRGNALCELGRHAEALPAFERALALAPGDPDILNNSGNALLALNRAQEALARYDAALAIRPNDPQSLINRGNALTDLRRLDDALADYGRALAIAPDHAEAHWNKSLILLGRGDFTNGWPEYEWRLRRTHDKRNFPQPQWRGESIAGRTILLHAEQGYGDTIQFVRYAPLVAAVQGATVVVEVQTALKTLLAGLPCVTAIARGETLPPFDLHCPLMSLPLAFNTSLDTIPSARSYLKAPADRVEQWRGRIPQGKPLRVGLAWSGSATHKNDQNRSVALSSLTPLFADERIQFVSLQRDMRDADLKVLRRLPDIRRLDNELQDFADTAAVISLLDLVISVDTSVAHLAGALGKPVWILLPFNGEWRWLSGRDDSPWYPGARLFRQPNIGGWDGVVMSVARELAGLQKP